MMCSLVHSEVAPQRRNISTQTSLRRICMNSHREAYDRKYWDFTVNEHAFSDIPSFVEKIREIKASEGITFSPTPPKVLSPENANREDVKASVSQDESGDDLPILTVVSHSVPFSFTSTY